MTWIKTISPEEAGPELRTAYEEARAGYPPEYGVRVPSPAAVAEFLRRVTLDEALSETLLIAAWFNSINRVADGLGVGRGG